MSREIIDITPNLIPAIAPLYADVFASHPWYEVSRCSNCGRFSKTKPEEGVSCTFCSEGTFDSAAYPYDETVADIQGDIQKKDAVAILSVQLSLVNVLQNIEGFTWGWADYAANIADKFRTEEMKKIAAELLVNSDFFFYISEVGVIEQYRGNGIGTMLVNELMKRIPNHHQHVVLFTNQKSGMRKIASKLGMKALVGYDSPIKDPTNEDRVLFYGKRNRA